MSHVSQGGSDLSTSSALAANSPLTSGSVTVLTSTQLQAHLRSIGHPRVLIVGDLMLDSYIKGDVERISPEAPIPVLAVRSQERRLGGAGNVAVNLRAMEAKVGVVGVVGEDGLGRALRDLILKTGATADGLVVDPSRPTIEKARMLSGVQQILRVDHEDAAPISGEIESKVIAAMKAEISGAQAVILSDYGKGVLTRRVLSEAVAAARAAGIPCLVDPKGSDYSRYNGATTLTPNKKEAEQALGRRIASHEELPVAGRELMELAGLDFATITLGSDGIFFMTADGKHSRIPTQARDVFDVTGAGDTVVAHMALNLAAGLPHEAAISLANHAAGIVVGRLGASSVTRVELEHRLAESLPHEGKVLTGRDLQGVLAGWRAEGKRIVFTNGCFDLLHVGHVEYLRFSRAQGDVLLVGVNDDASVSRLKGPERPVNTLEDRMKVLAALEMVDAVTSFSEDTPAHIVETVTPDVLVKGQDWADKGVVGREWVESHGGEVVLAALVDGKSTTSILKRAKDGRSGAGV